MRLRKMAMSVVVMLVVVSLLSPVYGEEGATSAPQPTATSSPIPPTSPVPAVVGTVEFFAVFESQSQALNFTSRPDVLVTWSSNTSDVDVMFLFLGPTRLAVFERETHLMLLSSAARVAMFGIAELRFPEPDRATLAPVPGEENAAADPSTRLVFTLTMHTSYPFRDESGAIRPLAVGPSWAVVRRTIGETLGIHPERVVSEFHARTPLLLLTGLDGATFWIAVFAVDSPHAAGTDGTQDEQQFTDAPERTSEEVNLILTTPASSAAVCRAIAGCVSISFAPYDTRRSHRDVEDDGRARYFREKMEFLGGLLATLVVMCLGMVLLSIYTKNATSTLLSAVKPRHSVQSGADESATGLHVPPLPPPGRGAEFESRDPSQSP